jgi:hypothetical protein
MTDQFGPITLKWDPKNLEIRTMSVEKTLEPLVLQVSFIKILFNCIKYIYLFNINELLLL